MTTHLLLIRHGESEQNAGVCDHPDSQLTAQGRRQAERVAVELAGRGDLSTFVGIVSPYRRAQETAELIAATTGLAFEVDEAVREWGATAVVNGRTYELEAIEQVVGRLRTFLTARRGQRLLVVSHGTPISLLTQMARGEEPTTVGRFWEGVENCCLRPVTHIAGAGAGDRSSR